MSQGLSRDTLVGFLQHDDPDIRAIAFDHLLDAYPDDASVTIACFDMVEREGEGDSAGARPLASLSMRGKINDDYVKRLIARTQKCVDDEERDDVLDALAACPSSLLAKHADEIAEVSHEPGSLRADLQDLVDMSRREAAPLWEQFIGLNLKRPANDNAAAWDRYEDRLELGFPIARELGQRSEPATEEVVSLLAKEQDSVLEELLIVLLEARRDPIAIDILTEKLMIDDEDISDAAAEALICIGGEAVVEKLDALYRKSRSQDRDVICGLLDRLPTEITPRIISELLDKEGSRRLRTHLLIAACQLLDHGLVLRALEAARSGDFDEDVEDLRLIVPPYAALLGLDYPERAEWEIAAREFRATIAAQEQEEEDEDEEDEQEQATSHIAATTPFVRDAAKTGRNDLCPCGSGKKYKKCCLEQGTLH